MLAARIQYQVTACMIYLVLNPGPQHWGLCIPHESENPINVGTVSIRDLKEPLRMTNTLGVTTLSASIERSGWHKYTD